MDESMWSDFQVISAALRRTFLNFVNADHVDSAELEQAKADLVNLAKAVVQFAREATGDPDGEKASLMKMDVFLDMVALLWQIAWVLHQKDIEILDLSEPLSQLHTSLKDSTIGLTAYETLASELLQHEDQDRITNIQWEDEFSTLDNGTRKWLEDIDNQITMFLQSSPGDKEDRLQTLHSVLFDYYFGLQQRRKKVERTGYQDMFRGPWQRRYRQNKIYKPTSKKFLFTYSAVVDFYIRLNTNWLTRLIKVAATAEGKTSEYLVRELGEFLQALDGQGSISPPSEIRAPLDILKAILGYIKITNLGKIGSSKCDVRNVALEELWDLIDLMNKIGSEAGSTPALGGAAATGAQALATLGEENVHLLVPFPAIFLEQPSLLDSKLKLGWYDFDGAAPRLTFYSKHQFGPLGRQPEIHNFIFEFSSGAPIVYCSCCGAGIASQKTDRMVVRSKFAYYQEDGRIDRDLTQPIKVRGLFGFDSSITSSLSEADSQALAQQAAAYPYDVVVVAGLQSLESTVHKCTEKELAAFKTAGKKIHVEVSGVNNLEWVTDILPKYVHSVGVGEELQKLFETTMKKRLTGLNEVQLLEETWRQEQLNVQMDGKTRGYQKVVQALDVASTLKLERLYYYDLDLDIIVRKGRLSPADSWNEIKADLIAKWVVLRKFMSHGRISSSQFRDTMTQVKEEGLATLVETAREMYLELGGQQMGGRQSGIIELYGAYYPPYDRMVILVPVRWVYGAMQDQLRVIGAGDTTSIISAAQAIQSSYQGA